MHTFQFLTKHPRRYSDFLFPENCWLGTTVDNVRYAKRIYDLARSRHKNLFISFEPLLTNMFDIPNYLYADIKWIIIGGLSKSSKKEYMFHENWLGGLKSEGYGEGLIDITNELKIPVYMKNNLRPFWKYRLKQEFPDGM